MSAPRIALDAHGSEAGSRVELQAAQALHQGGLGLVLVGDRSVLEKEAAELGLALEGVEWVDAPERITMADSPGRAVRRKSRASMPVAFDLVREGKADAVLSAGNSGAMLACGLFKLGRLPGVDRPAIVTALPRPRGFGVLLDVGANIDCRTAHFVQFAAMGAAYARLELGRERPTVAILSNGAESSKGTALTRAANEALAASAHDDFEYIGYVEGNGLFDPRADVIVTDGFTGNVVLKVLEGGIALFSDWLDDDARAGSLRSRFDAEAYGGAPLLGVNGVAVIAHGASNTRALVNAGKLAAHFVREGLTAALSDAIARHALDSEAARSGQFQR